MQRVDAAVWRDAVSAAIADGHSRFVTLMAIDDDGLCVWLRLRNAAGQDRELSVAAADGVPTLIDLLPDVAWCEREAAEMFGIEFAGHDTKPLVLAAGATPPMPKSVLLDARQSIPWPGEKEPGGVTARRRALPPGVAGGTR
jgi:NADH-quinone oxidoreductase subunit C